MRLTSTLINQLQLKPLPLLQNSQKKKNIMMIMKKSIQRPERTPKSHNRTSGRETEKALGNRHRLYPVHSDRTRMKLKRNLDLKQTEIVLGGPLQKTTTMTMRMKKKRKKFKECQPCETMRREPNLQLLRVPLRRLQQQPQWKKPNNQSCV